MFNLDSDVKAKGAKSDGEANSKPSSSKFQCYIMYVSLAQQLFICNFQHPISKEYHPHKQKCCWVAKKIFFFLFLFRFWKQDTILLWVTNK